MKSKTNWSSILFTLIISIAVTCSGIFLLFSDFMFWSITIFVLGGGAFFLTNTLLTPTIEVLEDTIIKRSLFFLYPPKIYKNTFQKYILYNIFIETEYYSTNEDVLILIGEKEHFTLMSSSIKNIHELQFKIARALDLEEDTSFKSIIDKQQKIFFYICLTLFFGEIFLKIILLKFFG